MNESKDKEACAHPGCSNKAMPGLADGYCQTHHRRSVAGKDMDAPLRKRRQGCSVEGCDRKHYARGLCSLHYNRQREGSLEKECVWWNCSEVALADGLCLYHFKGRAHRRAGVEECDIEGCHRKQNARGLCNTHYLRWLNTGDPGSAALLHAPKGAGHLNKRGYVEMQVAGEKRHQHLRVADGMLGERVDTSKFEVHHKNGIRNDNRPENLEIVPIGHGAGQHFEDLVPFIVEHGLDELYRRDGNCEGFPSWARKT